ncbi:MAG: amidohydrolase [Clostridiales bacterium]|jgi:amidohydrolase|nr:amidohydrolase [Clostridiales bacterium]
MELSVHVLEFRDKLKEHRRALHRLAEPSEKEFKTQRYILGTLRSLGFKPQKINTGAVLDIPAASRNGGGDGDNNPAASRNGGSDIDTNPDIAAAPANREQNGLIALRADIDALCIHEQNNVEYKSLTPGVMHACGHDGHTAVLLCVAELFRNRPPARAVRLIFQPAEEGAGGAAKLIERGVLKGVGEIYGLHVDPSLPAGTYSGAAGPVMAGMVEFDVEFKGLGVHCAERGTGKDALMAAALYITGAEELVKRYPRNLLHTGKAEGGTVRNAVAERAAAHSTLRYFENETRDRLFAEVKGLLDGIAAKTGVTYEIRRSGAYPPVVNDAAAVETVKARVPLAVLEPRFGAEDFAEYLQRVPGCFVNFGVNTGGLVKKLHATDFDFDEAALLWGLEFFDRIVNKN